MVYYLGIDIGSTTVKAALLDNKNNLIFRMYLRHNARLRTTLHRIMQNISKKIGTDKFYASVTGSGGISVASELKLPFVQEVIAGSKAVKTFIPRAKTIIELGGEDAKVTFFEGGTDQRMNGICAGGTGAFIDQMAVLLKTDAAGLNELAKNHTVIYPIAARCGVFAKSDIQPLLNDGAKKEDIAASIFQAVVNQTIAGLACGRTIKGNVAFIGGPLTFLPVLTERFKKTLRLKSAQVISPRNSEVYVAMGAAVAAKTQKNNAVNAIELIKNLKACNKNFNGNTNRLPPLFKNPQAYTEFKAIHKKDIELKDLNAYGGSCYLGLDIGSTTSKAALIDNKGNLLCYSYINNSGSPLQAARQIISTICSKLNSKSRIACCLVTGYGEHLIKQAFNCDFGEVETVCHYTAAKHFMPDVDSVLDIGGQDMKFIKVQNGKIKTVILNEACSSGCGSFIETFARCLNISVDSFAESALQSPSPADLGSRCTVFMNSKVKQMQKEDVPLCDISAGLCYSVIKNALYKVIKIKDASLMGNNIIVQGGTFLNDAILRCFELITGKNVLRPALSGIMGAYGAALLAKNRCLKTISSIISPDEIKNFSCKTNNTVCKKCPNNCLLTINIFNNGKKYITGNRCEAGAGGQKSHNSLNLYKYKYNRLFSYIPLEEDSAKRGIIGIPRVLNMYENYPFWFTFFTALKFKVVLSPPTDGNIYRLGLATISSDTACYPAKIVNGHIIWLINSGIKNIFYPCIVKEKAEVKDADNTFNCPMVISYPEVIKANIDLIKQKSINFYNPFLPYNNIKKLAQRLFEELKDFNIPLREIKKAVKLACGEDKRFKEDIKAKGIELLEHINKNGIKGIVLSGRPYHIDGGINHGIPDYISSLGVAVFTEDSVCHMAKAQRPLRVLDQWMYHSRLYDAAEFVSKQNNIELVQLNSFGCGPDSIAFEQAEEILNLKGKTNTLIKIDEINNLGGAKIRIRSLIATMEENALKNTRVTKTDKIKTDNIKDYTILAPQMSPVHFELVEQVIRVEGYNFCVLPDVDREAVEEGLKYVNNDSCYPAIIVIGQLLKALKSGKYDTAKTAVILTQTGGPCRASNYVALLEKALEQNNLNVPVITLSLNNLKSCGIKINIKILKKCVMAVLYGDLLMKLLHRVRPYEINKGEAQKTFDKWMTLCKNSLISACKYTFINNINGMISDFKNIKKSDNKKIKVGLVGEILVKYHPAANNNMAGFIENEGGEIVVPGLAEFFLYCAYNKITERRYLGGSFIKKVFGIMFIRFAEQYTKYADTALQKSGLIAPPLSIDNMAKSVSSLLSVCNYSGEGWLLTAEMCSLMENGVKNIICMQPFACLPNHITGKGMINALKHKYGGINIATIDYDSGASEVNQLNRIKLMMESGI